MSQTKKTLTFGEKQIILIGTAHVSKESCEEVESEIKSGLPSVVAIELDEQRFAALDNPESWKELDIIKVLKEKKGFLLLANLVLASFQRRMGINIGVRPGDEMRAGINAAKSLGIPSVMVDRPVQTTLRRAWAKTGGFGRIKLLSALMSSAFDTEDISTEEIEGLKKSSEMDGMMAELSGFLPSVKEVLIDERDFYLAAHIWNASEGKEKTLAVLGAGHLPGVEKHLLALAEGSEKPDTTSISSVPEKKPLSKIVSWGIPALIVALIASGFVWGGVSKGADLLGSWIFWNGLLAGLGALIALAHPLSLLVSVVGAPLTSLCPFVGIGLLSGLVQAVVRKPRVSDMETLQDDVSSVKGFYKNRILHVLLVFILSSIGSTIGTFVAGSSIVVGLTQFITGLFQ